MSMMTEQVVKQLQQELFMLRAQVAAESGLADAVRAEGNGTFSARQFLLDGALVWRENPNESPKEPKVQSKFPKAHTRVNL